MGLDFYQQPPDPRYEPEARRIAEAKAEAVAAGRELLTPAALSDLFDASPEAIRLARSRGRIEAPLEVMLTGKAVPMTLLGSGVAYWGDPDPGRLHEMRLAGTTLSIDGICYLVLHTGSAGGTPISRHNGNRSRPTGTPLHPRPSALAGGGQPHALLRSPRRLAP